MDFAPAQIQTNARKRIGMKSYRCAIGFCCQGEHGSISSFKKVKDSLQSDR